jgi:hypothetical protein
MASLNLYVGSTTSFLKFTTKLKHFKHFKQKRSKHFVKYSIWGNKNSAQNWSNFGYIYFSIFYFLVSNLEGWW